MEEKQGAIYIVGVGDVSVFELTQNIVESKEKLPLSDKVKGSDPIQRYPNSVMISFQKDEGFPSSIIVDYGTMDGVITVAEWYKKELANNGWLIKKESMTAEKVSLSASKSEKEVGIIVQAPSQDRSYTLISIHYGEYKLPIMTLLAAANPSKYILDL